MSKQPNQNRNNAHGASERKLWFRYDIITILALLAVAAVGYFVYSAVYERNGQPYCEFILDGKPVMTSGLTENKRFSLEGLPNVVFEIKDGAVAFAESDCRDKICVHSGYLHFSGQTAVCLPNRAVIRIKTRDGRDVPDIVI